MFKIITDSTTDLPKEYLEEHDVGCLPISYILDGVTYGRDRELDWKEFYAMMRDEGKMPTTSQINPAEAKEQLGEYIAGAPSVNGGPREILYLAFSSGLSGTCGNIRMAAEELMEEHPDVKIMVVDSLGASMGEGLFVHKAVRMRDEGIRIKKGKSERNKKRFPIPYTLRKHFFCNLIALFSAEPLKIIQ